MRASFPGNRVERVFLCPLEDCQRFFIARYYENRTPGAGWYALRGCVPAELQDLNFRDELKGVSPDFCEIYNQAQKAEQLQLSLVAGPGYRKALEFLMKDYLIKLNSQEAETIKNAQLGTCVAKYVNDGRVKSTASRAAWLGNDETHYVRKWQDKDLQDLKRLIALTVNWIEAEELTKDAVTDMPDGKR